MKSASQYRTIARENLKNNWGNAILVCLIVLGIATLFSSVPFVGAVATIILIGQLTVGELRYFINLNKKENATIKTMFTNFGDELISNFVTYLLQVIYTFLWTLLFIIPGIVKAYSYSMTFYLKAKEPLLQSNEAITKSREIMNGKKWKLFCLHFSFIGWIFLVMITFGILLFYVVPYMEASVTVFYDDAYNEYLEKTNIAITDKIDSEIDVESSNDNVELEE